MLHENKAHYIAITGIVVKDGKYLITKRSANEKNFANMWTVPGGKLEVSDYMNRPKDTSAHWYNVAEEVLRREVREETGLEIKNIRYLTSLTFIRSDNVPVLILSLFADYDRGDVVLDDEGIVDSAWVSLEEAREYDLIEGIYEELEMLDGLLNGKEVGEWKKGSLVLNDDVYGEEEITEPVLIELISSQPVQRLKGINQYGMPDDYYHKKNFSRFDHSIGVLILLRKLGASLKEQIAGLLHDISHTAFSHVVDWALGDSTKQDYQDKIHFDIIKDSEIPSILEKYGVDYKEVSELERFSLLEKEIPSLCADRIDYSLRELALNGKDELAKSIVPSLSNRQGDIVFGDRESAERLAREFLRMHNEHWGGEQAMVRYHILAKVLKRAFDNSIISMEDLRKTDLELIGQLRDSRDEEIINNLNLLKGGLEIRESNDEGILMRKKLRFIDPEIYIDKQVKRLSELSPLYKDILDSAKKKPIEKRFVYNDAPRH
jgi:hypothetical protein